MRLYCNIEIARPPEVVFPWIAEPRKAMQWQKNVKGGEITRDEPGVVGTTFTEIVEEDGRALQMTGVISHYDRNRSIVFHLSSRIHEFDVSYVLHPIDAGTRFSIEALVKWKFPMNIVSAVAGRRIARQLTEQLCSEARELKEICERG